MDIRERIYEHTGSFLAGWAAWLPLCIWIIALVNWMIIGEIDVLFGLAGIGAGLLLGFLAIIPPAPIYSYVALIIISGTVMTFPLARSALNRRQLKAVDLETLERAYHALTLRPDNTAAKFKIARLVYDMGYPGHAIRIAEGCMANAPQSFFMEEHRLLAHWRRLQLTSKAFEPLPCVECHLPNQPGNIKCAACGAPFLLQRAQGKILPGSMGKRLLIAWIVMVGALAGSILMLQLDNPVRLAGIFGLVMLALIVLILSFRPDNKGANA